MSNFTVPLTSFPTVDTVGGNLATTPLNVVSTVTGSTQVLVTFSPPTFDGGSTITGYTVTSNPGNITATGGTSPITVSGLTSGTTYTFTVTATNENGVSESSVASASVTTWTVPTAPTNVVVNNIDLTTQRVSFTVPTSDGGQAITGYTVKSGSVVVATGSASPIIISDLTAGTSYSYTVYATNSVGDGVASEALVAIAGQPNAPTSVVATAVDITSASVEFAYPTVCADTITGYTVTSSPGNITATGTTSPILVSGLTGNTTYTFTVVANSSIADSSPSAASSSATTYSVPDAPINIVGTRGYQQITVDFAIAAFNGGSPVTGFTIETYLVSDDSFVKSVDGTSSPIVVTGLLDNTQYYFKARATNEFGTGSASPASATASTFSVPGAPTAVTAAVNGDDQMSISFTAPSDNGGMVITEYTATSTPGNLTVTGTSSPLIITGLDSTTSYTYTVRATNFIGTGVASAPSNAVTALGVPAAPTNVTASPTGPHSMQITFNAPTDIGGSAITQYAVHTDEGNLTFTGTSSPINATGLILGVHYQFTVRAINAIGTGLESQPSSAITTTPVTTLTIIGDNSFKISVPANTPTADVMYHIGAALYSQGNWYWHDIDYGVLRALNHDGTTYKYVRINITGTAGNATAITETYEYWNNTTHAGTNRAGPPISGQTYDDYKKTAFWVSRSSAHTIYVYAGPNWFLIGSDVGLTTGLGIGGVVNNRDWTPADYRGYTSGSTAQWDPVMLTYVTTDSASLSYTYCDTHQLTEYTGMSGVIEIYRGDDVSQNSTVPNWFWTHTGWWIDDNNPKPTTYDTGSTEATNISYWNSVFENRTANVIGYMPRNTSGQLGAEAGIQATSAYMLDTQTCYLRTVTSTMPTNLFNGKNPIFDIGCKQTNGTFLGMVMGIKPSRPTGTSPALNDTKIITLDDKFFIAKSGYGTDTSLLPIPSRVSKTRSTSSRNTASSSNQNLQTNLQGDYRTYGGLITLNRSCDNVSIRDYRYSCKFDYPPTRAYIPGYFVDYGYRTSDPFGYGRGAGYYAILHGWAHLYYNRSYTAYTFTWPTNANTWDFRATFYIPS